jgi:hypothetical protein
MVHLLEPIKTVSENARWNSEAFLSLLTLRVSVTFRYILCVRCWFLRPVACQHGTKLHWSIENSHMLNLSRNFPQWKIFLEKPKGTIWERNGGGKCFELPKGVSEWNWAERSTICISATVTHRWRHRQQVPRWRHSLVYEWRHYRVNIMVISIWRHSWRFPRLL